MIENEFRELTDEELKFAEKQILTRTRYEKAVYRMLPKSMKSFAEKNPPVAFPHKNVYFPDFFFHEDRICIEIDGKVHLKKVSEDNIKNNVFMEKGYSMIRIYNRHVCNCTVFWTKLLLSLRIINKKKNSARISRYMTELEEMIERECIGWTDYDECLEDDWFQYNYDQRDCRPFLFFNQEPYLPAKKRI